MRTPIPTSGADLTLGPQAEPALLVESLKIATRLLAALVNDAEPGDRAVIFGFPEILTGSPQDFPPRAAAELILHAHDVCSGLGVPFEPPVALCHRLREHTRPWPMWTALWKGLPQTEDPWGDLLTGSGRQRS